MKRRFQSACPARAATHPPSLARRPSSVAVAIALIAVPATYMLSPVFVATNACQSVRPRRAAAVTLADLGPTASSAIDATDAPAEGAPTMHDRRSALRILAALAATAAALEVESEPSFALDPLGTITTKSGLVYERLVPGTEGTSRRDGPPRFASRVWVRYTAHVDGFDGPVFDSSSFRGMRRPSKNDYVELTVSVDPGYPDGMYQALKLMKVGEKGRFVIPPELSYAEGKIAFDGDQDATVKKVDKNTTTYYDVELVNIIRP
eukprot:CAMPEP_0115225662 /NCGR_PEP_ID=MMETSP0270-20121206/30224_1 /TAXON_ID=71861 /ORGANISM="Scrippsiella trochoidea, Strain CCMP3099" /LENGTH=262 /DNA_ID=CAMNT_0002640047 /DNA_START=54 /DNA_END=838 /DNA_ORIENTATION=-